MAISIDKEPEYAWGFLNCVYDGTFLCIRLFRSLERDSRNQLLWRRASELGFIYLDDPQSRDFKLQNLLIELNPGSTSQKRKSPRPNSPINRYTPIMLSKLPPCMSMILAGKANSGWIKYGDGYKNFLGAEDLEAVTSVLISHRNHWHESLGSTNSCALYAKESEYWSNEINDYVGYKIDSEVELSFGVQKTGAWCNLELSSGKKDSRFGITDRVSDYSFLTLSGNVVIGKFGENCAPGHVLSASIKPYIGRMHTITLQCVFGRSIGRSGARGLA
jgi:hypothetical protein